MKPSMITKLANLSERLDEVNRLLSSEDATASMDNYRKLTREHAEITPIVEQYRTFVQTEADIAEAQKMLSDPDMKEFAQEEIDHGKEKLVAVETELQKLLLPKDPNDEKNIFLEIRAGTGGDESGLFAGDLFRMYSRYAERQGWKVEVMSANESEIGGYKEIIAKVVGQGAYSKLKFESGGHRVQRVPDTETQWDAVMLVKYPSRSAFLEMVSDPEYQEISKLRTAALEDAVLQPTRPWTGA